MSRKSKTPVYGLMLSSLLLLSGCASLGKHEPVAVSSVRGGDISLMPQTRSPVLVVKSEAGIGHARLRIRQALPEGMMLEFPGLKKLEFVALQKNGKTFVCHGTAELELPCSWGLEWPVGGLKRYAGGMTLTVPASVLAEPGEWQLEWVDFYRH